MRFSVLSSGSGGNATIVATDSTAVLIDCGVSIKLLSERAASLDFDLDLISAIVLTHEHGDHASGAAALARKLGRPIYLTHGTAAATKMWEQRNVEIQEISPHREFSIGDLTLHPAPVPHDAREPCQFVIEDAQRRKLGVLTDIGSVTPHIEEHYRDCHALVLEFNHDTQMLAECAYPDSLKSRVGGRYGHFSNEQARLLLEKISSPSLGLIVAAHLSENSNSPGRVQKILQEAPVDAIWHIAEQHQAMPWATVIR